MGNYIETLLKQSLPEVGEAFGGSIKLTRSMAFKLRPIDASMEKCVASLLGDEAKPCAEVKKITILFDQSHISFHRIEQERQALCRMMRACPVANHATPEQRRVLSCGQAQRVFDQKLGKT